MLQMLQDPVELEPRLSNISNFGQPELDDSMDDCSDVEDVCSFCTAAGTNKFAGDICNKMLGGLGTLKMLHLLNRTYCYEKHRHAQINGNFRILKWRCCTI